MGINGDWAIPFYIMSKGVPVHQYTHPMGLTRPQWAAGESIEEMSLVLKVYTCHEYIGLQTLSEHVMLCIAYQ